MVCNKRARGAVLVSEQQGKRSPTPPWLEPQAIPPAQQPSQGAPERSGAPAAEAGYQGGGAHAAETTSSPRGMPPTGPAPYPPAGSLPPPPPPPPPPQQQQPPKPPQGYSYAPQPTVASHAARRSTGERGLSVEDLSSATLLTRAKKAPRSGWRKAVYLASGRTVNLGESEADIERGELIGRINQPLHGCYKIAMLSLKGGVGKTTTTVTRGSPSPRSVVIEWSPSTPIQTAAP